MLMMLTYLYLTFICLVTLTASAEKTLVLHAGHLGAGIGVKGISDTLIDVQFFY